MIFNFLFQIVELFFELGVALIKLSHSPVYELCDDVWWRYNEEDRFGFHVSIERSIMCVT